MIEKYTINEILLLVIHMQWYLLFHIKEPVQYTQLKKTFEQWAHSPVHTTERYALITWMYTWSQESSSYNWKICTDYLNVHKSMEFMRSFSLLHRIFAKYSWCFWSAPRCFWRAQRCFWSAPHYKTFKPRTKCTTFHLSATILNVHIVNHLFWPIECQR